MFCRKCGDQIPDESAFCNKCGTAQKAEAESPAAPLVPQGASLDPPGPEKELWRGRFSGKALAHLWILWVLWMIGLLYLYLGPLAPAEGADRPGWQLYALLILALGPALWILWKTLVMKLTVRYRLTSDRLFKEVGFISRTVNEVELIRVDDVSVAQNLVQRIFNVGRVTVISTDSTDPRLEILGINNPIELKETIRTNVRRRRDRALHMESL